MQKHLREALAAIRAAGAEVLDVRQRGHYRITIGWRGREVGTITLSCSPSGEIQDRARQTAQRLLRSKGCVT